MPRHKAGRAHREEEEHREESYGAYEIAQYILKVEVNDTGMAALRLEELYASDPPSTRGPRET